MLGVYRAAMRDFARQANLDVWYASLDLQRALTDLGARAGAKQRRRFADQLERARSRDSASAARKITVVVDGQRRFASSPPLLVPVHELFPDAEADELQEALGRVLGTYRASLYDDRRRLLDQFRLVDVARKVVGVGSVGSRAWVLLLTGRDDDDLLLLQAKEAGASVLEPYCPPSAYPSPGERVVAGQRLMQASSDIFLGWDRTGERDGHRQYYLRQLRDGKVSAEVGEMSPRRLAVYAGLCAWTLARAHARAGDRVAIAAYLGRKDAFEQALAEYAETYADRVEGQFHRLQEAAASGAVPVERGV